MRHRIRQLTSCDHDVSDGLPFHLFAVNVQRHWHRTKILGLLKRIHCARFARVCKLKPHFTATISVQRSCRFEQFLLARKVDEFLRDLQRQTNGARDLSGGVHVLAKHGFQHDVAHHDDGQLHLLQALGRRWCHHGAGLHVHYVAP